MFTEVEQLRLVELYEQNRRTLECSGNTATQNAGKNRAWELILQILNAEFPGKNYTVSQLKIKWKNLKQKAKGHSAADAKARKKTGGKSVLFQG